MNVGLTGEDGTMCDQSLIEDEFHFICICPKYDETRTVLYHKVTNVCFEFHTMSNEDKFIYLMSHCEIHVAIYIKKSWELRKSVMFI